MTSQYRGRPVHPVIQALRDLRQAEGLSLAKFSQALSLSEVTIGSYERGDRQPTMQRVDELLARYGLQLAAVPIGSPAAMTVMTGEQIISSLRAVADQLERMDGKQGPEAQSLAALRQKLTAGGEAA